MSQQERGGLGYFLLAAILVCMWGGTFVSTKVLLTQFDPVSILLLRCCIAWCALFLFYPRFHRDIPKKQEMLLFFCGLSGFTVYFLMENYALTFTGTASVSLLVTLAPVFTLLFARFGSDKVKIRGGQAAGCLLAFFGVFLVVGGAEESAAASNPVLGGLLATGAALSWSLYGICLQRLELPYPQVYITRKIFFYAILSILPYAALTPRTWFSPAKLLDWEAAGNLLFLGVGASALGYVCWNVCVRALGSARTSVLIYFIPLVTVLLSAVVLEEPVTVHTLLGAALIIGGAALGERRQRKEQG